jgi:uncharacterized membrane protein
MVTLICTGILFAMVALPFVSTGYGIQRLYATAITILSVFFVIGGVMIAKYLNKLLAVLRGKTLTKNASQARAYLIILLVLIPYFFCVTGVTYQIFGVQRAMTLNSGGEAYNRTYIHDQESCCAKWLKRNTDERAVIYGDYYGTARLNSQGVIRKPAYARALIEDKNAIEGYVYGSYIYLRYTGVVDGKLLDWSGEWHNITEYKGKFGDNNKIYSNGGSEVWK